MPLTSKRLSLRSRTTIVLASGSTIQSSSTPCWAYRSSLSLRAGGRAERPVFTLDAKAGQHFFLGELASFDLEGGCEPEQGGREVLKSGAKKSPFSPGTLSAGSYRHGTNCRVNLTVGRGKIELCLQIEPSKGYVSNQCPNRNAVSPITERLPAIFWLMRVGGTLI